MYFKLTAHDPKQIFSYLLSKNPASPPFVRSLTSANDSDKRSVIGKFVESSLDTTSYEIIVKNDEAALLKEYRKLNLASYVSSAPYAVNPRNLKGVMTALRSAIRGKADGVDQAEIDLQKSLHVVIGPFLASEDLLIKTYTDLEFNTKSITSTLKMGDVTLLSIISHSYSLSEFLQRILIGAYALSIKDHVERSIAETLIDSLVNLSENWLNSVPSAKYILSKLTHGRRDVFLKHLDKVQNEGDKIEDSHEARISIHKRRHETIVEYFADREIDSIVDLGCGDGDLIQKFTECEKRIAVDADGRRTRRAKKTEVKLYTKNILLTAPDQTDLYPDLVLCSEVIEHMVTADRKELINQIVDYWQPAFIALTTPNREYNSIFGMPEGELRHWDHEIEYDPNDLNNEVITPLKKGGYLVEVLPVKTFEDSGIQPSFIVIGSRITPVSNKNTEKKFKKIVQAYSPLAIEEAGYTISEKELKVGYVHDVYRKHLKTAFYLSPTIAPVDYNLEYPDHLEHPSQVFKYYAERGVTTLVGEEKCMGSRGHILAFRTKKLALEMEFQDQVSITSRNGFPFFKRDVLSTLESDIVNGIDWESNDFMLLDCEVMPWSYKAGKLILTKFRQPGQAAYIYKSVTDQNSDNVQKYMDVLNMFDVPDRIHFKVFSQLAVGSVRNGKWSNISLPCLFQSNSDQLKHLNKILSGQAGHILDIVMWNVYDVKHGSERAERDWHTICKTGEGMVFKPDFTDTLLTNGTPIQPALKVRGQNYLRLIYGFDYLEPENFKQLVQRDIKRKRRLALQENAVSRRILMSYFKGMAQAHKRLVAGFLGMDGLAAPEIDQTL